MKHINMNQQSDISETKADAYDEVYLALDEGCGQFAPEGPLGQKLELAQGLVAHAEWQMRRLLQRMERSPEIFVVLSPQLQALRGQLRNAQLQVRELEAEIVARS